MRATLKTRISKLEKSLNSKGGVVAVSVAPGQSFFEAAQQMIESGKEPAIIDIGEILKEINGTGLGLPSPDDLKEFHPDGHRTNEKPFSIISLAQGELLEDAVNRLRRNGQEPHIFD